MAQLIIQIPDDLARGLAGLAASQRKSVEELAVERLRSLVGSAAGSRESVLRAMKEPPHLNAATIDDLEAAIAHGRRPVIERGAFDK